MESGANVPRDCHASRLAVMPDTLMAAIKDIYQVYDTFSGPCKTIGSEGEACVFPFIYEGIEYDGCTSTHAAEGAVWCATQVNQNGTVIEGKWGDCSEGCPGASTH